VSIDLERDVAYNKPDGKTPFPEMQPGDFLLHHASAFHSKLIRFGEGLRFRGKDRQFAYWNHASFVVGPSAIVEALGQGIVRSDLKKYAGSDFARVRVRWEPHDRDQAVAFARAMVGAKYGFATLVGIGFHMLTGGKLTIGMDGTQICSGLVARCLERGPTVFEHHDPSNITPADLARHFQISRPN
jgi:hypothetical protein